ncbi:S41 family peptidase [Maribacter chungangensis]|uniref:S41 family peptidase n=1 Tax=Maribacter chungangensis TaxID=1069117 RepID=A0ABW3B0S0_9FLAO
MKILIKFIVLLLISSCANSQKKEIEWHPIVQKAKETSLYTKQVEWKKVNQEFIALTKDKTNIESLKEGLQFLINSIGDKHGQFRSIKNHALVVRYTGSVENEHRERDAEFINTVINDVYAEFSYQLLENKVGCLRIVGIGPGDVKEQANFIRNGLRTLKDKGVNKWIVDLRFNGGGNIEPMVSGIAPLIGEGFVGGAINAHNVIRDYTIKQGQFYNYERLACEMDTEPNILPSEKVAVLLSRYTISSGEMLAITLKGRPNTKFIGEETAGYTTGNGYDIVSDELALVISQDIFIDRNKNRYDKNVGVDVAIEFQHDIPTENDNQIKYAITWLNQ